MRKPIDIVVGYAAAQIPGGKDVTVEQLGETLKNVGIADASVSDVLTAARSLANLKREDVKASVGKPDPNLYVELAEANMRLRIKREIESGQFAHDKLMHPDSYYRRRWFEKPYLYIPLCVVFWAFALVAIYLGWKLFAFPFDWFEDMMWDWFDGQDARRFAAWTATVLAWATLAVVLIFHRRLFGGAIHVTLGSIRTLRRWFGRIEEMTRP